MEAEIAEFVSYSAYFFTLLFNTTLIYLTAYHTKRISLTYRHMIIGFALFGIGFSSLDIVVRPIMHSYNGCFLYFSLEGVFRSSKKITEVLLAIYSAVYSSILSFLTIQYMFRTCLVMKPRLVEYFQGWRCVFWLGYVFVFGFAWGFITYVYAYPDDYAREYVRSEMYEQYQVHSNDVPLFVLLAYGERNNTKFVRFQSLICIFGDMGIMTLQYAIMMICGFLLYKKISTDLKEATAMTAYSQVQKQFFKALLYQLLAPSLLVHLPAVPLFFAPFFDMKFSFRTRVVVYFFSVYPLLDSLILFIVVSDYKHAVRKIIAARAVQVLSLLNVASVAPTTSTTRYRVAEGVL
ncbi:CRE-STR-27 protein [Caenorhabditis remanei]|uniref:CRE-STR-27 protein n=1 Tax=Caenorhabditis remanei TaxID=31234 RepID=E3MQ27_CAERE|nr:CRE-STR-27 protein [Caenorhabditis remanei]